MIELQMKLPDTECKTCGGDGVKADLSQLFDCELFKACPDCWKYNATVESSVTAPPIEEMVKAASNASFYTNEDIIMKTWLERALARAKELGWELTKVEK